MKNIKDNSIDMILCDLPYGITNNQWDVVIPIEKLWLEWRRIRKDNTPIILTAVQPFSSILVTSNLNDFRYEFVWKKSLVTNFLNAHRQPMREHEQVLVFFKKQCTYNPQGLYKKRLKHKPDSSENYSPLPNSYIQEYTGYPKSIIEIKHTTTKSHPTEKPVKLFEYLIKTYSNKGDIILDCTAGSGTTAIACQNTDRNYICIEKEEKYYNIIKNRIINPNKEIKSWF